jgi:hypothetical protein
MHVSNIRCDEEKKIFRWKLNWAEVKPHEKFKKSRTRATARPPRLVPCYPTSRRAYCVKILTKASFRLQIGGLKSTVALSFVFGKYCLIMD